MADTEPQQYHWNDFLAPKYWFSWLGIFISFLVAQLPYSWLIRFGKSLGRSIRWSKRHMGTINKNIGLSFPEKTPQEQAALVRESLESFGVGIMEACLAWWISDARLKKMMRYKNIDSFKAACKPGKGILLLAGHFTSMELHLRAVCLVEPCYLFARLQNNRLFQWFMEARRARYIKGMIYKTDIRSLARLLKTGATVAYLPDQSFGHAQNMVFAPFFGVETATTTATARIARLTGANIVPCFMFRTDHAQPFELEMQDPLEAFPSGDDREDAARVNFVFESAIRQYPEQYLWLHRRFKTRPAGEQAVY